MCGVWRVEMRGKFLLLRWERRQSDKACKVFVSAVGRINILPIYKRLFREKETG